MRGPIAVWAPDAERVEVEWSAGAAGSRDALDCVDGWWEWSGDPRSYDVFDYAFVVDGEGPFPDPRSAWQPQGVSGPSRFFDTAAIRWSDTGWRGPRDGHGALGAVIYELHIGTFTAEGTLDAAIGRLDHLVDVGIDVVELLPVAAFDGQFGWGYDGVGLYAVHDAYGGPAALARFVDAAHARGLGVCLDVVHNHLGPSGNYLPRFGPYFTDEVPTPWGPAVNLSGPGSPGVRRFLIDQATRWLRDFHIDALRLDAVHALVDPSEWHFLAQLADEVHDLSRELGRPLELIAESDLNDTAMVTPTGRGGMGMDAQWADDVHHALHVLLTGERQGYYADFDSPAALRTTLEGAFFHAGTYSSFRGRLWGRAVDRSACDGHAFVAYLQTHDQVGNRAQGDRISASITPGQQAIGAALYLLSAFTPMIFMGEEWAAATPWQYFTSFPDQELGTAVRDGRRAEFTAHGWSSDDVPDPQDPATRDRSVLDWSEPGAGEHAEMLRWYRTLIALRRAEPDLRDSALDAVRVDHDVDNGTVVVHRGRFRVVANLADTERSIPLDIDSTITASFGTASVTDNHVRLGPHSLAIIRA